MMCDQQVFISTFKNLANGGLVSMTGMYIEIYFYSASQCGSVSDDGLSFPSRYDER